MNAEIAAIFGVLAATMLLFIFGSWRHDMVAVLALLACVLAGLVPAEKAFSGFGHPAVITVACVLVLSRMLQNAGAVDVLAAGFLPKAAGPVLATASLTLLGAVLSAFMNNVGALALLMPVALQLADKHGVAPGRVLMPLSFGSILGGMTTLIGTPPNLIVSGFRAGTGKDTFGMFDFSPVGAGVAGLGIVFLLVFGKHLIPERRKEGVAEFRTGAYLTEVRVTKGGRTDGKSILDIGPALSDADAQIVGLVRSEIRVAAPNPRKVLRAEDIIVLEADPEDLAGILSTLDLEMIESEADLGARRQETGTGTGEPGQHVSDQQAEIELHELAVRPDTGIVGRSAVELQLRSRFGINLLALSRQGKRSIRRLRSQAIRAGDVLLVQGSSGSVSAFALELGLVPLAERSLRLPDKRKAIAAAAIMGGAIAGAAFGLLPASISFLAGVLVAMALRLMPLRLVYATIDWSVVVLLGALIPVAGAMAETGAADYLAGGLVSVAAFASPVVVLVLLLVLTMTLSDFMNNAATAAVMCPIAIGIAAKLDVNADSFLMAVAIGASCAFLTPIGHQNNTLILGPAGFRFGDYWRLGLPMEVLIVSAAVPLLLFFWPL